MNSFISIADALKVIKQGRPLILIDSAKRENEGDFFLPAQKASPASINLFLNQGRGLLNVALCFARAAALDIFPIIPRAQNTEKTRVNFAISLDAKKGVSSGASVFDRVKTIKLLGNLKARASDFTRPGHVFPLIAHEGGVKARAGHTEAAVTLSVLAGFNPAGILCEILTPGGQMARLPYLKKLSENFGIPILKISELMKTAKPAQAKAGIFDPQNLITQIAQADLPTVFGKFKIFAFRSVVDGREHASLLLPGKKHQRPLVRVHSQCLTGDALFSQKCDCGEQLKKSLSMIAKYGRGLLIYLNQEGRGIGFGNKIKAYSLQDKGLDTVQANRALGFADDARNFEAAAAILRKLKMTKINLLTNNPNKLKQLRDCGIRILKRIPLLVPATVHNAGYLTTKKTRLGHYLETDAE